MASNRKSEHPALDDLEDVIGTKRQPAKKKAARRKRSGRSKPEGVDEGEGLKRLKAPSWGPLHWTLSGLARELGTTGTTVKQRLEQAQVCPVPGTEGGNALYLMRDAAVALFGRRIGRGAPGLSKSPDRYGEPVQPERPEPKDEKARLDRARADKVEIEIDIMRGELIHVDNLVPHLARYGAMLAQQLRSLHHEIRTIAPELDVEQIEQIRRAHTRCLESFTDDLAKLGATGEDPATSEDDEVAEAAELQDGAA